MTVVTSDKTYGRTNTLTYTNVQHRLLTIIRGRKKKERDTNNNKRTEIFSPPNTPSNQLTCFIVQIPSWPFRSREYTTKRDEREGLERNALLRALSVIVKKRPWPEGHRYRWCCGRTEHPASPPWCPRWAQPTGTHEHWTREP